MSASCVFCRIISGDLPSSQIYSDQHCVALLDIHPINEGHVLIVPRNHFARLADVPEDVAGHLFKIGKKVLAALQATSIKCEGANLFLSDGPVAGQEVMHSHLHIAPRFIGDGQVVGFKHAASGAISRERLNEVAQMVQRNLPALETPETAQA